MTENAKAQPLTEQQVNDRIRSLANGDFRIPELEDTGKAVAYQGWYWRDVSPDHMVLAHNGRWVGFCENNKWGFPTTHLVDDEAAQVWQMLESIAIEPTFDKLQALYDHLQTFAKECER